MCKFLDASVLIQHDRNSCDTEVRNMIVGMTKVGFLLSKIVEIEKRFKSTILRVLKRYLQVQTWLLYTCTTLSSGIAIM